MNKLLRSIKTNKMTLIVSLPSNSKELAKAAAKGGADALKVHMNVKHEASGVVFGGYDDEKAAIGEVIDSVKIPVGIMPGNEELPSEKEMDSLKKMGIDFFDLYHDRIPGWMFGIKGMGKVAALSEDYSIDRLIELKDMRADSLEAAIVPKAEYGKDLTISDLQNYITIAVSSSLPVIVPTQKFVRVSDVPLLLDAGIKGLMIGVIVTGDTPESIYAATKEFRAEIDRLEH